MKLMTKALAAKFPKLYAQENRDPMAAVVGAKFFTPDGSWTWYATEYDAAEEMFFGYVDSGAFQEWGYFALADLQGARGPLGLAIERDLHLPDSYTVGDAIAEAGKRRR